MHIQGACARARGLGIEGGLRGGVKRNTSALGCTSTNADVLGAMGVGAARAATVAAVAAGGGRAGMDAGRSGLWCRR